MPCMTGDAICLQFGILKQKTVLIHCYVHGKVHPDCKAEAFSLESKKPLCKLVSRLIVWMRVGSVIAGSSLEGPQCRRRRNIGKEKLCIELTACL